MEREFKWARHGGYEVSTKGDARFSAFNALMPDKRSIEQWYQCDVKGYDIGGTNWRLGKGKPPLLNMSSEMQWDMYLNLWRIWTLHHGPLMVELYSLGLQHGYLLSDRFASSRINQARALAQILNEWFINP